MTTLHLGGYTSDRPDSGLGTVAWEAGLGTATPLGGPQDPSWLVPVPGSDNGQVYAVAEGPGEVALVDGSGAVHNFQIATAKLLLTEALIKATAPLSTEGADTIIDTTDPKPRAANDRETNVQEG